MRQIACNMEKVTFVILSMREEHHYRCPKHAPTHPNAQVFISRYQQPQPLTNQRLRAKNQDLIRFRSLQPICQRDNLAFSMAVLMDHARVITRIEASSGRANCRFRPNVLRNQQIKAWISVKGIGALYRIEALRLVQSPRLNQSKRDMQREGKRGKKRRKACLAGNCQPGITSCRPCPSSPRPYSRRTWIC